MDESPSKAGTAHCTVILVRVLVTRVGAVKPVGTEIGTT